MRIESFQPLAFLALYFLTVLAVTALLAWPAWGLSSMLGGEIEFHKLAGKTFHVVAALSLWPLARMLGPSAREVLGWNLPVRRFLRDLAAGFLLGVAILSMLTGGLLLLGVREWAGGVSGAGVVLAKAVVAGLVIGLLEETFFRGAMFRLLRRAWPAAATIGVLSLFYAGLHFLRVPALAADAVAWNSGFVLLGGAFTNPSLQNSLGTAGGQFRVNSGQLRYRVRFKYPIDYFVRTAYGSSDTTINQKDHYIIDTPVFDDVSVLYFPKMRILDYREVFEE